MPISSGASSSERSREISERAAFNIFAAPGQPFIDSARVRQDITALDAVISRVNTYTSKAIAHRDDNPQGVPAGLAVTWVELDAALDTVGNTYKKYYRLRHAGEAIGILTPLESPGWIQMFETAWVPPGFILPHDPSFEPPPTRNKTCKPPIAQPARERCRCCRHDYLVVDQNRRQR